MLGGSKGAMSSHFSRSAIENHCLHYHPRRQDQMTKQQLARRLLAFPLPLNQKKQLSPRLHTKCQRRRKPRRKNLAKQVKSCAKKTMIPLDCLSATVSSMEGSHVCGKTIDRRTSCRRFGLRSRKHRKTLLGNITPSRLRQMLHRQSTQAPQALLQSLLFR